MNRRRYRPTSQAPEGTSLVERILGGVVGAGAGALLAFTFDDPSWLLGKWYVGICSVLGLLFGLAFANKLWDFAREQFESEMAESWGWIRILVGIVVICFVIGMISNGA